MAFPLHIHIRSEPSLIHQTTSNCWDIMWFRSLGNFLPSSPLFVKQNWGISLATSIRNTQWRAPLAKKCLQGRIQSSPLSLWVYTLFCLPIGAMTNGTWRVQGILEEDLLLVPFSLMINRPSLGVYSCILFILLGIDSPIVCTSCCISSTVCYMKFSHVHIPRLLP